MQKFAKVFDSLRNLVSRKMVYVLVGLALAGVKAKCPDCNLPSADLITDMVLALLAAHTLTDVVSIVAVTIAEQVKAKG